MSESTPSSSSASSDSSSASTSSCLLCRAFAAIFGVWTPPAWLRVLFSPLSPLFRTKLSATISSLVILALLAGAVWLMIGPSGPPKPEGVTIDPPGLTDIAEGKLKPNPLVVRFEDSAAQLSDVDKKIAEGVKLEPPFEGQWEWEGDRVLKFEPAADWPAGTRFHIKLRPGFLSDTVKVSPHALQFETPEFTARLRSLDFQVDPENPDDKRIVGQLSFSHPVTAEDLAKHANFIAQGGNNLFENGVAESSVEVDLADAGRTAYIRSASITPPDEEVFVDFRLDGLTAAEAYRVPGAKDRLKGEVTKTVSIPDRDNYLQIATMRASIIRARDNTPRQVVVVETTAPVATQDLANALSAHLLPKDRPASALAPAQRNYNWKSAAEVTDDILAAAESVELEAEPTEAERSTLHSFRVSVPEGRRLLVAVKEGVATPGGYELAEEYRGVAAMPEWPREVRVVQEGTLLALSGDKKISIEARGLGAVRFRVAQLNADTVNHLVTQTSGDLRRAQFRSSLFNENNISEVSYTVKDLVGADPATPEYTVFDFAEALKSGGPKRGLFVLDVQGFDPRRNQTVGGRERRLILVTDLGVIAKRADDGSTDIFVQTISKGTPVNGATVELLGKNGVALHSRGTSADGRATFPAVGDLREDREPTVFVARVDNDVAFLPYQRQGRVVNYSRFDIGGSYPASADALEAFIFSDRGLYRPGHTAQVGIVVKRRDWAGPLAGIPLEIQVRNSKERVVRTERIQLNASGFHDLEVPFAVTDPTGTYTVAVYLVREKKPRRWLGSASLKVEEFLPDRLAVKASLNPTPPADGWVVPDELVSAVEVSNLYGAPASGNPVRTTLVLEEAAFDFADQFPGYAFATRPAEKDESSEDLYRRDQLPEATTDNHGRAETQLPVESFANFEGLAARLTVVSEALEKAGGRGVTRVTSTLVSDLPHLVGVKPDGDLNFVALNAERSVELIAVAPDLSRVALDGLQARIVEERFVSVLVKQGRSAYRYKSVRKEHPVSNEAVAIAEDAPLSVTLPTGNPGTFILTIENADGRVLALQKFSVAGSGQLARSLEKNAELQARLDAEKIQPGQDVQVHLVAPYKGAGLITLETDRVHAVSWFQAEANSSVQTFRIPEDFDGNGYLNITFVRALDSEEIFTSPLSVAVVPVQIDPERRRLELTLGAPEKVQPGDSVEFTVTASEPGHAVVYAVDQGILSAGKYETPEPLDYFLRKTALRVTTSQIVDLIMPEFSLMRKLSEAGGGGDREGLGLLLNPFRRKGEAPVAYWSGVIEVGPEAKTLTYQVPDYFNGTLTLMAVGISGQRAGSSDRKTTVKGPFVIEPIAPLFAAPGDTFEISATVANNVEGSGDDAEVSLAWDGGELLEVLSDPGATVKIAENGDAVLRWKVRAKEQLGAASFRITTKLGDTEASTDTTMSIRPPVVRQTLLRAGMATKPETVEVTGGTLRPEHRQLAASASASPLGLGRGLSRFLSEYPYGCTEQVISQAMPALALPDAVYTESTDKEPGEIVRRAFGLLAARQHFNGKFGYWDSPNSEVEIDWLSVYAMRFLLLANEKGYQPPRTMTGNGARYLATMLSKTEPENLFEARLHAQSLYILARSGINVSNYALKLRNQLDKKIKPGPDGAEDDPQIKRAERLRKAWRKDLTAAYLAATYQLMKMDAEAAELIDGYVFSNERAKPTEEDLDILGQSVFISGAGDDAQYIALVARHFPGKAAKLESRIRPAIIEPIAAGRYTTVSAAWSLLALSAFDAATNTDGSPRSFTIEALAADDKMLSKHEGTARFAFPSEAAKLAFAETGDASQLPYFWEVVEDGYRTTPVKDVSNGIELIREYTTADGSPLTSDVKVGDDVVVTIKARAKAADAYLENVAITDLLPGGFEPVVESVRKGDAPVDHVEAREDRVIVFTGLGNRVVTFSYRIRAVSAGEYTLPPAQAEAMYDPASNASTAGGKIAVVR